MLNMYENVL